jgi:UDP-N-acetylmuramate dehydrogenase
VSPVILRNTPLRALNSFGIDARAALLVRVDDPGDFDAALDASAALPRRLVLGGGSNLLFVGDFDGALIQVATRGRRMLAPPGPHVIVEAEAGEPWDDFVRWTLAQGLNGLENLSMIPGCVGASPIQNIGAYGVEMRERFDGLSALRLSDGMTRDFNAHDCQFGYRDSIFKQSEAGRWLITRVRFRLARDPDLRTGYGDLREELARTGVAHPDAGDVAQAVRAIRARKLPDPAVIGNAGSFFKNPVLPQAHAQAVLARTPQMPSWPGVDGTVKLSAAWMIDRCGWKGAREGDAGVHAAHALVLVNHGHATGAQILALSQRIRASVFETFGVALEPEPSIIATP